MEGEQEPDSQCTDAAVSFNFKPSVGTWLLQKRDEKASEANDAVWSVMVEIDAAIFEFAWPDVQHSIFRALRAVSSTWVEMGWRSQADLESTLQQGVELESRGPIARGLSRAEAEQVVHAMQVLPCSAVLDLAGAASAAEARGQSTPSGSKARSPMQRRSSLMKRLEAVREKVMMLGDAAPEVHAVLDEMKEALGDEDPGDDDLLDEVEHGIEGIERDVPGCAADEGGEPPPSKEEDAASQQIWSTMVEMDPEFPFDVVWENMKDGVLVALRRVFRGPPGSLWRAMGWHRQADMERSLADAIQKDGIGAIARGLKKAEAERAAQALEGLLGTCSAREDKEGAASAGRESNKNMEELRAHLRERMEGLRAQADRCPPRFAAVLDRAWADLNNDSAFQRHAQDILAFVDRCEESLREPSHRDRGPKFNLCLEREQLLTSALIPILRASPEQLHPGRLHVKIMGEDAEDAGGVTRAFLAHAGTLLKDPQFGLFLPALRGHLQLNPLPGLLVPSHTPGVRRRPEVDSERWCRFLGRLLGMSVVHRCPMGLLLIPSLCKRLLGREINFEDLSFAPVLNDTGGGGWYNSLKQLLANRAPEVVKDQPTLTRMASSEVDMALDGLEASIPSRAMQAFESLLGYVADSMHTPQMWDSALDVAACLLRGVKLEEHRKRTLDTITELLEVISSSAGCLSPAPGVHRALRSLRGVLRRLWPTHHVVEVETKLCSVLGEDGEDCGADDAVVNITGTWALSNEVHSKMFYYEWVQPMGGDRFTGQLLGSEDGKTISAGFIHGNVMHWEVDGIVASARLAETGLNIFDGRFRQSGRKLAVGMMLLVTSPSNTQVACSVVEARPTDIKIHYHTDGEMEDEWVTRESDRILGIAKVWQIHLDDGWKDYGPAEAKLLAEAEAAGRTTAEYSARGTQYTIDLQRMVQVNKATSYERKVRTTAPKLDSGTFEGVMMTDSELKPIRPQHAPDFGTWFTCGIKDVMQSSGRFYHEVKLGFDGPEGYPQLGWLSEEFTETDGQENKGVGDDEHGWATDGVRHRFWHGDYKDVPWPKAWKGGDIIGLAIDMEAGRMCFSLNGEWIESVGQEFELGGRSLYPALSMGGFFTIHISSDTWKYAPPSEDYSAWSSSAGLLTRPPPSLNRSWAPAKEEVAPRPASLERLSSTVANITSGQLSASNLPAFAKEVAHKTLVANLEPYLGPLTEEFRRITGERQLQDLSWESLQEMIAGRQMDPEGWIKEWQSCTTYTDCNEENEIIQWFWRFVSDRSPQELPKLFEWCTNYPAIPASAWKFHIALIDDNNRLPTINTCMTDDRGVANRGIPEPRLYLPPCTSKEALEQKMSKVSWEKGAATSMTLV